MKNILIFLLTLMAFNTNAQQNKDYAYITDVKPITWTKQVINTHTSTVDGNKTSSTIAGAGVGYLLHGGLLGTIVGGAIGNAVSISDDTQVSTSVTYVQVSGYQITTNTGITFKTFDYYKKWQLIKMSTVKQE